jgi:hypothetical protein
MADVCHFFGILRLDLGPVSLNRTQGAGEEIRALDQSEGPSAVF